MNIEEEADSHARKAEITLQGIYDRTGLDDDDPREALVAIAHALIACSHLLAAQQLPGGIAGNYIKGFER